jgi:uncharacterized protein HemY
MAKIVLSRSRDASTLDSAAYLLSEMKLELPLAEESSRRAIQILESASKQVSVREARDKDFSQTNLIATAWDTLGWVFFREGKSVEAELYIRASWFNRQDIVVGDHLAQVLEALQKPSEALTVDEVAIESDGAVNHPRERNSTEESARSLVYGGVQVRATTTEKS